MVIGRIERCAVADVEREGINYRIEMKVPGSRVVHVLRMPTAKEMQDHERASTSVVAARRSVETRAFLEPSGALYDKLHVSHDGSLADCCRDYDRLVTNDAPYRAACERHRADRNLGGLIAAVARVYATDPS
jgi:hypothetical protein